MIYPAYILYPSIELWCCRFRGRSFGVGASRWIGICIDSACSHRLDSFIDSSIYPGCFIYSEAYRIRTFPCSCNRAKVTAVSKFETGKDLTAYDTLWKR